MNRSAIVNFLGSSHLIGLPVGGLHVDVAFEALLRDRWPLILDEATKSVLVLRAVQDFELYTKRKFVDPSIDCSIPIAREDSYQDEFGVHCGELEFSGRVDSLAIETHPLRIDPSLLTIRASIEDCFLPTVEAIMNGITEALLQFQPPTQVSR